MGDEPLIAAWDRRVDWPLTALAAAFLGLYAWQILDRTMAPWLHATLDVVLTTIWVVLGLDYVVRVVLARRRWRYVGTHILDLLILVVPMFRPLRALRVVTVIGVLNRQLRDDFRGRIAVYVVGTVTIVGFVAALAVLEAERDAPDATITTFGEAIWWTITTISTVGYGDRYPVTVEGRLVAATLMVAGIALLGVVTASIASWFVANLRSSAAEAAAQTERELDETSAQLAEVLAELRTVTARLDAMERGLTRRSPS